MIASKTSSSSSSPKVAELTASATPWVRGPWFDSLWIFAPLLLPPLFFLSYPSANSDAELTSPQWFFTVLIFDVAHVWATLPVTYLNSSFRVRQKPLLILAPLFSFLFAVVLHDQSPSLFWRCLAYFAVFHFIRQQVGWMQVYSRHSPRRERDWMGRGFIWCATLIPLMIWHLELPKSFSWMMAGDFIKISLRQETKSLILNFSKALWLCAVIAFVGAETLLPRKINWGRLAVGLGTAATWWVGIVLAQGDFAFTVTNVIAHGAPYIALVYANARATGSFGYKNLFKRLIVFVLIAAYLEEALWAGLLWREHEIFFPAFFGLSPVQMSWATTVAVALLSTPQITHYLLDGFIWRQDRGLWRKKESTQQTRE